MAEFDPTLRSLTALLGEALGGPLAPPVTIDAALVRLAVRRHLVAPLLYQVAVNGRHTITGELLNQLSSHYRESARRRERQLTQLGRLADAFAARGIAWMTLKGPLQAARLYTDPAVRESADLDILVPTKAFDAAIRALEDIGFIASNPPLPGPGTRRRVLLSAVRDVTLIANDDPACAVDLHRRLFVGAVVPALPSDGKDIPSPAIGPELALYLLGHGAVSFWVRLRWTTDMVCLLPRLSRKDLWSLRDTAGELGMAETVAASLHLMRVLYPFTVTGALEGWLAMMLHRKGVQCRFNRYCEMIMLPQDWKSSPLDNALLTFEANWRLSRALPSRARLLIRAPLSSAARRAAGLLYPGRRALTLCDTPP